MSKQFQQVCEFNETILGIKKRKLGILPQAEMNISFKSLIEETTEMIEAHMDDNYIGCIDAVIDNIYFSLGILYKMGIDTQTFERIFTAVHTANMTKRLGINPKRGDGSAADAIKPEGWVPPEERIAEVLSDLGVFQ